MNQMLMAVARGARIQVQAQGMWYGASILYSTSDRRNLRIHPDDEHLRFGPISTALREAAVKPPIIWGDVADICFHGVRAMGLSASWNRGEVDELHRSLFLLILSEALAEDGL